MMFGDMFDTPEDLINKDGTNLLPAAERKPKNCASNLELPSLKRELKHFVGLRNLGATCYLNSLIQTLYLSPEFRNAIFSLPLCVKIINSNYIIIKKKDSAGNMSNFVDSENKFRILFALQKLLAEMQMLDLRIIR